MPSHKDYIYMASHQYECACALWDNLDEQMPSHIAHMNMAFLLYGCVCVLWDYLAK